MADSGPEGVRGLSERLGRELRGAIPDGAETVVFDYSKVGRSSSGEARGYTAAGDEVPADAPFSAMSLARELRDAMYRPGAGTWFSARFTVTAAGGLDVDFNYDDEPQWDEGIPDHSFVADLERYPRDAAARPEWLKAKVEAAAARPPEEPTSPASASPTSAPPRGVVVVAVEEALFDDVPYRPWLSPLGTVRAGADPGDRRVVGRLDGEPVSVTDLPPHVVFHRDPPGHARTHQYFERGQDFLDWVTHTAAGTRFFGVGLTWDDSTRHQVAAQAVHAGLEWDREGNIVVMPPSGRQASSVAPRRLMLRLRALPSGRWDVHRADDDQHVPLSQAELAAALAAPLWDVCCDDAFDFAVDIE